MTRLSSIRHENPAEVYATASKYGAKISLLESGGYDWECWADRVLMLPYAAARSRSWLSRAVDDANRYA